MKIVFLGDCITTQKAGIHYYAKNLIQYIVDKYPEHQYSVVLTKRFEELTIDQIILPLIKWIPFHLRLRQIFVIPVLINRLKPDIVIELAHFGPFNLRSSIKRVTVIHDLTPITHPKLHPFSSVMAHRFILKRILSRATFIIANSDFTRDQISRYFEKSGDKVCVVYPCTPRVDLNDQHLDFPELTKSYFLTVGTLEPRKNHATILKAFEIFCKENTDYQLVIVGQKGWKNNAFAKALDHSPVKQRVILAGYLTHHELIHKYSHARAFIFASLVEGFGLPILEASQFGLPLILAKNDSLPGWFKDAALLFDPTDAIALSLHMHRLTEEGDLHGHYAQKSKEAFRNYQHAQGQVDRIFR